MYQKVGTEASQVTVWSVVPVGSSVMAGDEEITAFLGIAVMVFVPVGSMCFRTVSNDPGWLNTARTKMDLWPASSCSILTVPWARVNGLLI